MNDDFGTRLGATLRESAPEQHPHLTLDDVAPVARQLKRRRTAAAIGGVAALTAVTALGGAAVLPSLTGTSPQEGTVPAASGKDTWRMPAEVRLATDAPRTTTGEDTGGDWFIGDAEFSPLVPFAPGAQDAVVRLGSRWLISFQEDAERTLYSIRLGNPAHGIYSAAEAGPTTDIFEAFDQADTFELHDRVAVSDGGDLAVFSTPAGVLTLIGADGETREIATLPSPGTPIDLVGDAGCIDGTDCQVVVSYGDDRAPEVVAGDGTRTVIDKQAVAADAATADLVATRTSGDGSTPCTTVLDRTTGDTLWENCETILTGFSPDGRLATVVDAYQSGTGPTRLGVADAETGKVLTWFLPGAEQGFLKDLDWTSSGGVEISSYTEGDQTWRLHRVAADGEVFQRVTPRTGTDTDPPHIAVTRP